MNPYSYLAPRYDDGYDDDKGQLRQRSRRTGESLIRDFLTKPLAYLALESHGYLPRYQRDMVTA